MVNTTKHKYNVQSVEQAFIRMGNGQAKQGFKVSFIPSGIESEYTVEVDSLDDSLIDSMIQDKINRILTISSLGG